jgi:hypothetical protein
MLRIIGIVLMIFLSSTLESQQSGISLPDLNDSTLIVYKLNKAEIASFSTKDNIISPFWEKNWNGRDYIKIKAQRDTFPGHYVFEETSHDASMIVKAGATDEGLYLCILIQDNKFVDPRMFGKEQYDACELSFDKLSSAEIKALSKDKYAHPFATLTPSSQQFFVNMGASERPSFFDYDHFEERFFYWSQNEIPYSQLSTSLPGMEIEVISIDSIHKAQEYFIPWNIFGVSGVSGSLSGRHFAFNCSYNDNDGGPDLRSIRDHGTDFKSLRWRGQNFRPKSDGWGDLVMEEDMPPVASNLKKVSNTKLLQTDHKQETKEPKIEITKLGSSTYDSVYVFTNNLVTVRAEDLKHNSQWVFQTDYKGYKDKGYLKYIGIAKSECNLNGKYEESGIPGANNHKWGTDTLGTSGKMQGKLEDRLLIPIYVTTPGTYNINIFGYHASTAECHCSVINTDCSVWTHIAEFPGKPGITMSHLGEAGKWNWLQYGPMYYNTPWWGLMAGALVVTSADVGKVLTFYVSGRDPGFCVNRVNIYRTLGQNEFPKDHLNPNAVVSTKYSVNNFPNISKGDY